MKQIMTVVGRVGLGCCVLSLLWGQGGGAMAAEVAPPAPCGAVPSPRQLSWQQLEYYGFLHFTVNTFTDKEWGYGDEDPDVFNPDQLDARQWARVARDAGMKGLILTAKHHDGFCLWPSRYTEHSVKNSRWRNGQGDVVREAAEACREFGLKFGVYLSPWDRNHPQYARPEYLTYYRNQLRELLTRYGPIFEVWFDGANGGDGYYGGTRETRRIDNSTYYDWPNTCALVRELQPDAVMFSDAGPDIRWVGNESGVAFETSWLSIDLAGLYPGHPKYQRFARGKPLGADWVPPEVDVSIRPGWFYHPGEDSKVKSVQQLQEIYYSSIGRSANLLLNIPPDRRGLLHEIDVERLLALRRVIDRTFAVDLARGARATAPSFRGRAERFAAACVNDLDPETYWATDDLETTGTVELEWPHPVSVDHVVLQEYVPLGQRVQQWNLEAETEGGWREITRGTTIGYKRIARFEPVIARRIRIGIQAALACPTLATVSLHRSPD